MPVLPVTNGYALRVSNLVRALSAEWRVVLAAPRGEATDNELVSLGVNRFVPVEFFRPWGAPLTLAERAGLRTMMDQLVAVERPDAALIWAGAEVAFQDNPSFPLPVIDRMDSEVVIAARTLRHGDSVKDRLRAGRALLQWAMRERQLVRQAAAVVVDSPLDASILRRTSGRTSISVIQSGVEVQERAAPHEETAEPTVSFTGSMGYSPNIQAVQWFVKRVWPSVRRAVPTSRFVIAGRSPAAEVRALSSTPGVEVLADVSDISPILRRSWLVVSPVMMGSGIRTKVLEAWAVGRPVIQSSISASGLRMDDETAGLVTDSPAKMAELVIRLMQRHDERHCLGEAAHRLVSREYAGWTRGAGEISGLLRSVSASRPAPR